MQALERCERIEQGYERLLESGVIPAFGVDLDGNVNDWNEGMAGMSKLSKVRDDVCRCLSAVSMLLTWRCCRALLRWPVRTLIGHRLSCRWSCRCRHHLSCIDRDLCGADKWARLVPGGCAGETVAGPREYLPARRYAPVLLVSVLSTSTHTSVSLSALSLAQHTHTRSLCSVSAACKRTHCLASSSGFSQTKRYLLLQVFGKMLSYTDDFGLGLETVINSALLGEETPFYEFSYTSVRSQPISSTKMSGI